MEASGLQSDAHSGREVNLGIVWLRASRGIDKQFDWYHYALSHNDFEPSLGVLFIKCHTQELLFYLWLSKVPAEDTHIYRKRA